MAGKYIFYDLETTGRGKKESRNAFGTTPKWEQILQIAAIVTDENFQPTNKNINEFCRPRTSIIAQPGALITTRKGIQTLTPKRFKIKVPKSPVVKKEITEMVLIIKESAPLSMRKVYVLQKEDNPNELMLTYNVKKSDTSGFLPNTILLHRKKETNTLYTINAVNYIIKEANNGVLDTSYRLQWQNYCNSILLTNKQGLNIINTRLKEIIDLEK